MKTTTVTALLPALRDSLQAMPALSDVIVSTVPLADTAGIPESIEFGSLEQNQDYSALGNKRKKEEYTLHGWIIITKYGAGEQVGVEARDRAYDILGELDECLTVDPTVGGIVQKATLTNHRLTQVITGETGNQRGAVIDFDISVTATLTRS